MKAKSRVKRTLIIAVAISAIVLSGAYAKADDFTFSFTNTTGNVSGTVTGEILGLTDNTTGPATHVIIESYPALFDSYFGLPPLDATSWATVSADTFTESSGVITAADFSASYSTTLSGNNDLLDFSLDTSGFSYMSASITSVPPPPSPPPSFFDVYTDITPTTSPVPEPGTISLALVGIGWLLRKWVVQA
jgi:hypothetical protein